MKSSNNLLCQQMEVFLNWSIKNKIGTAGYREWLELFVQRTCKADVCDMTNDDVDLFLQEVYNRENATYRKVQAKTAILSFIRYYMARSKNGKKQLTRGRPPAYEQYKRVGELRGKLGEAISFAEIGMLLNPSKPVDRANVRKFWHKFLNLKNALKVGD